VRPRYGFDKESRLLKAPQFRLVRERGERRRTPHFGFWILKGEGNSRLGISISKKMGGAVERNRVKRRIREFFRLQRGPMGLSGDILVSGFAGCTEIDLQELKMELNRGFKGRL
jgi:ribonuclease P protein component